MSPGAVQWLIIDGYSLLHRDPDLKPLLRQRLELARQRLIRKVEPVMGDWADRITIVFDGRGDRGGTDSLDSAIEVFFAPARYTADTVIERLVHAASDPAAVLVVTSDRAERETVSAAGADTLSCGDFLERLARDEARGRSRSSGPRTHGGVSGSLGDHFPV